MYVWIDEATGETKIEKYKGHLHALECDRCGFQTLKLEKEEVLVQPTDTTDGEILKEYKCSYCGRIKRKTTNLTSNVDRERDPSKSSTDPFKAGKKVESIVMEIHTADGDNKVFEFQGIEQAKGFLAEFTVEKLRH